MNQIVNGTVCCADVPLRICTHSLTIPEDINGRCAVHYRTQKPHNTVCDHYTGCMTGFLVTTAKTFVRYGIRHSLAAPDQRVIQKVHSPCSEDPDLRVTHCDMKRARII